MSSMVICMITLSTIFHKIWKETRQWKIGRQNGRKGGKEKGSKAGLRREEEGTEIKKKEDRGKRVNKRKKRRKERIEGERDGKQACSLLTE